MLRPVRLWNTASGKLEEFVPLKAGHISFYSCGPTVYHWIHLGNLRGGLVADLVVRYFRWIGYQVTYVRNYTDIDDKIIARAQQENVSAQEIAETYLARAEEDYAMAGMLQPDHCPRVTEHISEIIQFIQEILDQGRGYVVPKGDVFYSIETFAHYGQFSGRALEQETAEGRIERNPDKKHPFDFVLWKAAHLGEPGWDSPWGKGRPGWHIECSAMIRRWLGPQIDLHHGGEDLIFPHHENEIAQMEGVTGCASFSNYWLHHAFLTFSQEKMSKSLGNTFLARDFLKRYSGEVARFLLLSSHYRSRIDLNSAAIQQAWLGLERIYQAKQKASELLKTICAGFSLPIAESRWGSFLVHCESCIQEIENQMASDLNTPGVFAALFTLIREWNRLIHQPENLQTSGAFVGAREFLCILEQHFGKITGIGLKFAEEALSRLNQMRFEEEGLKLLPESEILVALAQRADARKQKDFSLADQIRLKLEKSHVFIQDHPNGTTTWKYGAHE